MPVVDDPGLDAGLLLASVAELEIFLETDLDQTRAELFLRLASGEVRAATGNLFTFVEDDVVTLDGKGSPILLLPQHPVAAVAEVLELAYSGFDEVAIADASTSTPGYEWSADGILRRLDGYPFRRRFRGYRVTYSHGYEAVPDDVVGVVLRCAAGGYENPEGYRQETLGRYSYTLAAADAGMGLAAGDLSALEPYMIGPGARPIAGTTPAGSGS